MALAHLHLTERGGIIALGEDQDELEDIKVILASCQFFRVLGKIVVVDLGLLGHFCFDIFNLHFHL
jgi:hypothetical protein